MAMVGPVAVGRVREGVISVDPRLAGVSFECADPGPVASFWATVFGATTHIVGNADRAVIGVPNAGLTLSFIRVDGFRPPTWPDSTYPQQAHLDIPVYDGDIAAEVMEALGAFPLPSSGSCPIYADPAGHPFCLCTNLQSGGKHWPAMPGLVGNIVLDCPKPQLLASLYSTLLGYPERMSDAKGWVVIVPRRGARPRLAFQGSAGHQPGWRDSKHPQQAFLDFVTDDVEDAMARLTRLGFVQVGDPSESGISYLDPAGHALFLRAAD